MQLRLLPMVLVGIFFTADAMLGHELEAADNDRPNIVVIMPDDQGYGDLSCFGSTEIKTPISIVLQKREGNLQVLWLLLQFVLLLGQHY